MAKDDVNKVVERYIASGRAEKDVNKNISCDQKSNYAIIEKDDVRIDLYYRKSCIYARLDLGG